jgi:hypothetical protein
MPLGSVAVEPTVNKAKNDVELLGRRVHSLRIIDQPAPDSHRPEVRVDLGESCGMVSEQFRSLGELLPRFCRSDSPHSRSPFAAFSPSFFRASDTGPE